MRHRLGVMSVAFSVALGTSLDATPAPPAPGAAAPEASVLDFGARGDGVADDTTAVRAAFASAAGRTVRFPKPRVSYKITDTIVVPAGTHVVGDESRITMALPPGHATGELFEVHGDSVIFDRLWIDGAAASPPASRNRYAIDIRGSAEHHLRNVVVRNTKFTGLLWANARAVTATHAVYNKLADFTVVEHCTMQQVAGAAVFVSQSNGVMVVNNNISDTGWYSIQLQDRVENAIVAGNHIVGTVPGGRMWGGSINLMSNGRDLGAGKARDRHILISDNYMSGVHSYTAAVQIESSSIVSFSHNVMEGISLTNGEPADYVRVYTRPQGKITDEGPSDHIEISDNRLVAHGHGCMAVYVDNQHFGAGRGYAQWLLVHNNDIVSPDAANAFSHGIIVNGQAGGWRDLDLSDNRITATPSTQPQAGAIGVIGRREAPVKDVVIRGNSVRSMGVARDATSIGIAVQSDVQNVVLDNNQINGFWNGIRVFPGTSAVSIGAKNNFSAIASAPTVGGDKSSAAPAQSMSLLPLAAKESEGVSNASMGRATVTNGRSVVLAKAAKRDRIVVAPIGSASVTDLSISDVRGGEGFTVVSNDPKSSYAFAWLILE
jgi:hypothetical protein